MQLARAVRNKLRKAILAFGPIRLKEWLWNIEYLEGTWNYVEETPNDRVYAYIEKSANGGSILDLGCGSGNTANELDANAYRDYTGVDISDVALDKAKWRSEKNGRGHKNRFVQSDYAGYVPAQQFDLILFRESIYYIPRQEIKPVLDKYSKFLKQDGVLIVRMSDGGGKSEAAIEVIENNFNVIEKYVSEDGRDVILVFRRQTATASGSDQSPTASVDVSDFPVESVVRNQ